VRWGLEIAWSVDRTSATTPSGSSAFPCAAAPTFDITASSREIDALVRQRLRAGEPLYRVDEALLLDLAPDVLITQTHCEVCAVSPKDVARGGSATLCRKQVVALNAGTLDGILDGPSGLGTPNGTGGF